MSAAFDLWLEAAYLYYIRPDLDPSMEDWEWDQLAREFEARPPEHELVEKFWNDHDYKFNTAFHISEEDYPDWIRSKHSTLS